MERPYRFLFPFEAVPKGSRVLIYGAGDMGQAYARQLRLTEYAELVGFIDCEWRDYAGSVPRVYSIEQVRDVSYDVIVISLKAISRAGIVRETLEQAGVPSEKIVYVAQREEQPFVLRKAEVVQTVQRLACDEVPFSIAMRIGNGIGSAVIKKRIYEELVRIFPMARVDLYTMIPVEDIRAIYGEEPSFHAVIHDGGLRFAQEKERYTLAFEAMVTLVLVHADDEAIQRFAPQELACVQRLKAFAASEEGEADHHPGILRNLRLQYRGGNVYTAYGGGGALDLGDKTIRLPLNEAWRPAFERLGLARYITLNFGNGQSMERAEEVNKQWPLAHFVTFARKFHAAHPDIAIVQLGAKGAQTVAGTGVQLFGEPLELVKHVLKHAIFHLDIEGGLVHIASQLGTKCIVLFGPTSLQVFGYEQNINLTAGDCHGCFGLYANATCCAKGEKHPPCMYALKPARVMEAAEELLRKLKNGR